MGWKCGCQPFSCPRSQNKTYCRKEICSTCLFKESIPAIRLWNSKHPFPARTTSSALWLHHAQPFVAAAEKNLSHDEKQRVWSRSSGLQDLLQYTDCSLSRDMRLLQVNEEFLEIQLLPTVGWKWGCKHFSCPCSKNVTHCRQEICSTYLFKESITTRTIPFWNSTHPLPARSRFLRAAVSSTTTALWLYHPPNY